jgi:hypothetical protein
MHIGSADRRALIGCLGRSPQAGRWTLEGRLQWSLRHARLGAPGDSWGVRVRLMRVLHLLVLLLVRHQD